MKKQQNNHLTMHLNTQVVLNENEGKFETFTAYPALKATIDESIASEKVLASNQESRKRNSTAAKNNAKKEAGEYILDLSSKVSAYAIVAGKRALLDKVKFNTRTISRSSDNKLELIFEIVIACASENLENVAEYGVTGKLLSDGYNLLDTFKTEIQNMLLSNSEQKQYTAQLEKQFKTTDAGLSTMDAMVATLRKSDPVMHRLYRNARRKKKNIGIKLSAKGKVLDAATRLPLPKAKLHIISYDNQMKALTSEPDLQKNVKIAGVAGGFQFKLMDTGTYLIKTSYAGYIDREDIVYINEGVLTRVEILLTKIA